MARIWSSGFELGSNTAGHEWTTIVATPGAPQTTVVRSGTYAGRISSLTTITREGWIYQFASSSSTAKHCFRVYLRVDTLPNNEKKIIALLNGSSATSAQIVSVSLDNTGVLKLYDEDGQITGTTTLSTGTWYRIEIKFDASAAAGSHIVEGKVDGTNFATASNRSLSAGIQSLFIGGNLGAETGSTGDWYFDDVAINNGTGSFQTDYPGEGEIIHLRPNAAGDTQQWIVGSGATFAEVDEVTPDDATTNISTTTLNEVSDFNIDATPAAMDSTDTINCVQVGVRFTGEDTGSAQRIVARIKASSGGTVEESGNIDLSTTTWFTNAKAVPRNYPLTLYDLPGASTTPWTKTDLDAAQIGVRHSIADALDNARVSTLWLLVDHKPGAGGGGGTTQQNLTMMGIGS